MFDEVTWRDDVNRAPSSLRHATVGLVLLLVTEDVVSGVTLSWLLSYTLVRKEACYIVVHVPYV